MESQASPSVLHKPLLLVSSPLIFLSFALPIYAKALGASALAIGGLFTVFHVSLLVLRPLVGAGLDRFGRRIFLLAALTVYGFASLIFAFSVQLEGLYLARLVQGVGASLLLITIDTVTADLTTRESRAAAVGANIEKQVRGGMYGALLGFTLISALPESSGWRFAFIGYSLLAFVGVGLALREVPETKPQATHHQDWKPWTEIQLSGQLKRLLPVVFTAGFASSLILPIYLIYLQDKFTVDVSTLGLAFFPAAIVFMLLPSRLGRISDRFGRSHALALGLLLTGLLYGAFPFLPGLIWLIVLYTLSAVGGAMAEPARTALVGDLAQPEERGRVFALVELITGVGASLGPLVGGWLYDAAGRNIPFYITGALLSVSAAWALLSLDNRSSPSSALEVEQQSPE